MVAMGLGVLIACGLVAGCDRRSEKQSPVITPPSSGTAISVYTTFYPTAYFAARIAGDRAEVVCPVPPDADPIFWQPTREQIARFQSADMIIINGAGYEKWISTASLPESRVVDSCRSLPDPLITFESVTHNHGSGGAHTHQGVDGHTWMDPMTAIAQAAEISAALSRSRPADAAVFASGFAALEKDLRSLDTQFAEVTPLAAGALLLASHPAYNYPSRRYSLGVVNVAIDPERDATADDLAAVDAAVKRRPQPRSRVMLWESQPTPATAAALKDRFGIVSVVFSPCETADPQDANGGETYLTSMRRSLAALRSALGPTP